MSLSQESELMFTRSVDDVKRLLDAGVDVNYRDDRGWTVLINASYWGKTAIVRALLAAGADVNVRSNHGDTALMWASYRGKTVIVQALLAENADVNVRNDRGETALMIASSQGKKDTVELLLRNGADVGAVDNEGQTALMIAKRYKYKGHREVASVLEAFVEDRAKVAALLAMQKAELPENMRREVMTHAFPSIPALSALNRVPLGDRSRCPSGYVRNRRDRAMCMKK